MRILNIFILERVRIGDVNPIALAFDLDGFL